MDGPKAVIHDISSDEEEATGERSGVGADDYDWLARLLEDDKGLSDDSDDVVVVGEVTLNSRQTVKSSSTVSKDSAKAVDDDDGDCVVLEGDPDKPVTIDNDEERDDDSDEIQVVSEKGQVACRDYPHPRHHCAKFPFASTPHDSYCDQCHCYVCDSLAPCGHWGNGSSNMDHCHATDKDEFWKAKRQNTKKNNVVLAAPSGVDARVSVPLPLVNQSPLPPQLVSCNVTQNQAFAQCPIRPCSVSVSPGTPNITRQQGSLPPGFSVPNRLPGYIIPRSKFQDHLVSQQIRNGYRNGISTDRRPNTCQVSPHLIYSRTAFKRTGSASLPLTSPRHGNTSSHNHHRPPLDRSLSLGPRYVDCRSWMAPVTDTNPGSFPIDLGWIPSNPVSSQPQLSVQPSLESESVNYLPSGPQIFSQPQVNGADSLLSESQVFSPSPNYANPLSSQPRVPYQPALERTFTDCYPSEIRSSSQHVNGVYENSVPSDPQTLFQPYVESNSMDTALHSQASEHPNGVNNFENPMHPRPELAYQAKGPYSNNLAPYEATVDCQLSAAPCMTSNCENTDQLESSAARISLDSQNISHPANQTQNAYVPDIASLDFSREVPFCEINEPHVASADKFLLAPDPNSQLAENSSPSALDLHFDNWMFEDPVVPRVIEVSVPLGLNAYSPEPAPLWD
nr:Protein like [Ipomoea batatas]